MWKSFIHVLGISVGSYVGKKALLKVVWRSQLSRVCKRAPLTCQGKDFDLEAALSCLVQAEAMLKGQAMKTCVRHAQHCMPFAYIAIHTAKSVLVVWYMRPFLHSREALTVPKDFCFHLASTYCRAHAVGVFHFITQRWVSVCRTLYRYSIALLVCFPAYVVDFSFVEGDISAAIVIEEENLIRPME